MSFRRYIPALAGVWLALQCPGPVHADNDSTRIALGLDVGASVPGMTSFYSHGIGKAYVLSGQFGEWRLDWRVGESYDLRQANDLGAHVDGSMTSHSMSVARVFGGPLRPALSLGAARLSTSLATIDPSGRVVATTRDGIGLIVGAEAGHPISSNLELLVGVRGYLLQWEEVAGPVIYEADETSFSSGVEPEAGIPISMTVGVRVFW